MGGGLWWRGGRLPSERRWGVRAIVVDTVLAVTVAALVSVSIGVASEPGSRPPDLGAYALALLMGALLLGRRRWPLGVLLVTIATLMAYYLLEYPGIEAAFPLAVGLYTAASAGRLWWAIAVASTFTLLRLIAGRIEFGEPILPLLYETAQQGAVLLGVVLLGETVRSRRIRLAQARELLRRAEVERELEAARRAMGERLRIAREVHDVLGHTIAAITVQAGLADDVLDRRPAQARQALRAIRAEANKAIAELKEGVGLLRAGGGEDRNEHRVPTSRLDQLGGLLETARAAGLRVEASRTGTPRSLPAPVELAAYRIIQEAMTNTIRHARASSLRVVVSYEADDLVIEVIDDGQVDQEPGGAAAPGAPGGGLVGMAERAAAVGGTLTAAPSPVGGFQVRARLPIQARPLEGRAS